MRLHRFWHNSSNAAARPASCDEPSISISAFVNFKDFAQRVDELESFPSIISQFEVIGEHQEVTSTPGPDHRMKITDVLRRMLIGTSDPTFAFVHSYYACAILPVLLRNGISPGTVCLYSASPFKDHTARRRLVARETDANRKAQETGSPSKKGAPSSHLRDDAIEEVGSFLADQLSADDGERSLTAENLSLPVLILRSKNRSDAAQRVFESTASKLSLAHVLDSLEDSIDVLFPWMLDTLDRIDLGGDKRSADFPVDVTSIKQMAQVCRSTGLLDTAEELEDFALFNGLISSE